MRVGFTSGVMLSIVLSCTGDLSTTDNSSTTAANSGSGSGSGSGGSSNNAPDAWPEGTVPFDAGVTLVHEGKLIDPNQTLRFATGPAGIGEPVELAFVLSNHGEALSFDGDWITGDGYSLISETPIVLASKASVELRVHFDPQPLTAATEAAGALSIPAKGMTATLQLLAEVPRPLRAVIYGRGGYTAISNDYGANWLDTEVPTELETENQTITWGNGRFFRTWRDGPNWSDPGRYAWSDDGLTWHSSTVSDTFWPSECDWGLNRFVCARSRWISWSQDGNTVFHESGAYAPFWNAMTFAEDRFVAVGRYTGRAISTDGATWTQVEQTTTDERLYDVAFGGGLILAVGGHDRHLALVSSDGGLNWTTSHWNPGDNHYLTSAAWFDGRFIISGSGTQNCLLASTDGEQFNTLDWNPQYNCPQLLGIIENRLYAAQTNTSSTESALIWSTSDAINWTEVHSMPAGHRAYDMAIEQAQ